MPANGLIAVVMPGGHVAFELVVKDARVVDMPPYARRLRLPADARMTWRALAARGCKLTWEPESDERNAP
jgi:hypothetical protein